ncbi:unnamed protein product, partial [Allacma fusca]
IILHIKENLMKHMNSTLFIASSQSNNNNMVNSTFILGLIPELGHGLVMVLEREFQENDERLHGTRGHPPHIEQV